MGSEKERTQSKLSAIEDPTLFSNRKRDHIHYSLSAESQSLVETSSVGSFHQIDLGHEALPAVDFSEVDFDGVETVARRLGSKWWGTSPYFLSSMTAGHSGALSLNRVFARAAEACGWPMGVGSQRRELYDQAAASEWQGVRAVAPQVNLLANIGVTQLISIDDEAVSRLVESTRARALFVHLNPMQEVMQPEGTPQFRGALGRIEKLVRGLRVPVIVKETGSGLSFETARRLFAIGVAAIDVGGRGGTHWGRVEGLRAGGSQSGGGANGRLGLSETARSFKDWGFPTLTSVQNCLSAADDLGVSDEVEVWASGGIRSGLDAAKAVAVGASRVGIAQPILKAALAVESGDGVHGHGQNLKAADEDASVQSVIQTMQRFEYELRVALFCTSLLSTREPRDEKRNYQRLKGSYQWRPE